MKNKLLSLMALCLTLSLGTAKAAAITRYVTLNGAGDLSGSSWENAAEGLSASIQVQINDVNANADRGEVRFGAGTYVLSATLTLKDGASLMGGYPATPVTGTNDTRNWVTNQTIFDGGDARKLLNAPDGAGIIYTHITNIDGLIIQRGRSSYGSAVAICYGFVMQNCIIRNNTYSGTSSDLGGAIRIYRNSFGGATTAPAAAGTPNALNCGGGLINCLIVNNTTTKGPAAINIDGYSSSSIINCVIANNLTTDTRLTKLRNTNSRGYFPGGIFIGSYAHGSRVVNNIFYNNSNNGQKDCDKHLGSGFYAGALYNNYFDGDQAFKDSVAVYYERPTSTTTAYYKNFNNNNNKCNVDFAASTIFNGANTVLGSSTTPEQTAAIESSDWSLKTGSGCINAGVSSTTADVTYPYIFMTSAGAANRAFSTITSDLDGNTRIVGANTDMGAYESNYTVTGITKSVTDNGLVIVKGRNVQLQNAATTVDIFNAIGAKVYSRVNVAASTSINMTQPGVYMVKVKSENGMKVQKIIVY